MNSKKSSPKQRSKFKKQFASRLSSSPCAETTYGKVLDDGCAIDVVVDQATGTSQLFVHTIQDESIAPEFQVGELVFRPGEIPPIYRNAIHFPERVADFGSPEDLFSELRAPIESHGFSAETSALAAFFLIATWFADVLPQAPVLSITGPEREASLLLDLLACTTRRGLRIGEFDLPVLRALPVEIGATLLISAAEKNRAARQLFRNTNYHRILTPRSGRFADFYCAKAVYDGAQLYPAREHAMRIRLLPFAGHPGLFRSEDATALVRELQPKLASYRAKYAHDVCSSRFDTPNFANATRNLAQLYGAPLAGNKRLEAELIDVLKRHENDSCEDAWTDFQSVVLETCVQEAHVKPGKRVTVGEIAASAKFLLSVRGDDSKHADREVGAILSGFGVHKQRRAEGWMFTLDNSVSGRFHDLACQQGVLNFAPAGKCRYCDGINVPSSFGGSEKA